MSQVPVAIVGVSALFPGSADAGGFWRDILAGRDLITDVPPSHWLLEDYYDPDPTAPDKTYSKRGAFLQDIAFDPMEYGIPPSTVPATDTSQLLALIVAQQVLEDASKGQFANIDREKMSIILGVTSAQELMLEMTSRLQKPMWLKGLRESGVPEAEAQAICEKIAKNYGPWQTETFPGLLGNVVAGRIANRFDLRGTNAVTDAACASALAALSMGLNELYTGQSDVVIAGGVDTMNDISMYVCFSKTPALSKRGDCAPFSDKADGTVLGEGLGMMAMKRLSDAERDGDNIYAVITALGSSSDGRAKSVYAPLPEGQARALRRCYESAGYGADTVELVEAHGTGTVAGDAAEFEGLRQVFQEGRPEGRQWCALGSVKSQIGHTKAAAGAAGMFKAVLALHHKVLPPTIKIDRPNPKISIETSPFYLNTTARPWIRGADHPRRASVSSFGFGGSNFHVALEEYAGPQRAPRFHAAPTELVLITGKDAAAVTAAGKQVVAEAKVRGLEAVARESQEGFRSGDAARLAIVAASVEDLEAKVAAANGMMPNGAFSTPTGSHFATGGDPGKTAFLFPGQGSQYVGMGGDVAIAYEAALEAWDATADVRFDGRSVADVVFPIAVFSDHEREAQSKLLTQTEWAQPAIGVASLALLAVLRRVGISADCVGGHSFGEVTALASAGALDASALLQVARKRGELMRDAASVPGSMLAVGKPIEEVRARLEKLGADVVVANHNHPTQVVLSGSTDAVVAVEKALSAEGIAAKRLPVATAFHSSLVAPSSAPFRAFLGDVTVAKPAVDVFSNAEAAPYPTSANKIRDRLAEQIAKPVRFVEQIEAMYARGVRTFIEVGPAAVLTELVGRILGDRPHRAVALDRKGKHGVTSLQEGLGRLAVAGLAVDFKPLWADVRAVKPPKKAKLALAINGTNYAKPYPPPGGAKDLPKPNAARPTHVGSPVPATGGMPAGSPERSTNALSPMGVGPEGPPRPAVASVATPAPVPQRTVMSDRPTLPPAPVAAPRAAAALPADAQLAWVGAYQEAQRQTAETHAAYQRAMAESHMAFLRAVETSFQGLSSMMTGAPAPSASAIPTAYATLPAPMATPTYAAPAPVYAAPAPAPALAAPAPVYAAPSPVVHAAPAAPAPAAKPVAPAKAAAPSVDLNALMMAVVAEKTGYPAEMLGLHMELEGDLGIDSIKRVEILSTMRERAPQLPEIDGGEMAALRTLGQIVDYMQAKLPSGGSASAGGAPTAAAVAAPAPAAAPVSAGPAVDLNALMMAVVAEKTGYPAEMLGLHMELEGDLGIDSIKRVEILSTMRERAPQLPEIDGGEMAALRTLGQIVDYMQARLPASAAPAASSAPSAPAAASQGSGTDLNALMMAVVAEKTGYPAEMLGLHMELEGDLGIDSIKRVEILSTMRERAPELPEIDGGEMAALRTLGQIVDYMQSKLGGAPAAQPQPSGHPGAAPVEDHGIQRFAVREGNAPAIGLAMNGLTAGGRVVVSEDGGDLAGLVVRRLGEHGVAAQIVDSVPADADVVVFLGGLRAVADREAAMKIDGEAFRAAKAVAARFQAQGGVFVTVQDLGGDFGLSGRDGVRAWMGGIAALARTAAVEWPKAAVKSIDIERGGRSSEAVADAIVAELFTGGNTREVGLHADGRRTTLLAPATPIRAAQPTVDESSVIVASGGGRGVTASALVALAQRRKPRIVVLGRTALEDEPAAVRGVTDDAGMKRALMQDASKQNRKVTPAEIGAAVARIAANREIRGTLAAIEAAGGKARYIAADVQDAKKLAAALDDVRVEWGPITGIVHGAGVLADKLIAEKTPEQFDRVFDTKVLGLRALLDATANDPLTMICLFSSVAARTGNLGQCDYACANDVLNKVAWAERARRGGACVVKSIGWGPWAGGMVTPGLKARFEQMGVALIPLDVGARMFVDELEGSPDEVETVIGGAMGEGALGADADHAVTLEVKVDRASHPYLADHAIAGKAVVPVVLVMEWLARAACAVRPDLSFTRVADLKVMRGIRLDGFDAGGDRFTVHAKQLSNGDGALVGVELRGAKDVLHYTAQVQMSERPLAARRAEAGTPTLGDWSAGEVYDGHLLFHGPQFQVIRSLDGVSDEGIAGTLVGTRDKRWQTEAWRTDVAALDGGLQLAVLWARHVLGGATLPMAVGAYHRYEAELPEGPIRCVVRARQINEARTICDVAFAHADGRLIAELRGVETVLRPGEKSIRTPARA